MRLRFMVLMGTLAVLLAGSAVAVASPVGIDFRVSGKNAVGSEFNPAVAHNPNANQYLVVWSDDRDSDTRGRDIYGRRVAANGTPLGGDFRISGKNATGDEINPAVSYNSTANEYLVVWADDRNRDTRKWDIDGRRVSANGTTLGADFRISGKNATGSEHAPAVAHNPKHNQYLVVWGDTRNQDTRGWDIYGRRMAANGTPLGGDFRISGKNATHYEWTPAVAYNSAGSQYLVVWADTRNDGERGDDIYGRRVATNGTRLGGDFRISGKHATAYEENPAVGYNPEANQYLVAWSDSRREDTRGRDIYGRRVATNGTRLGGDFRVSGAQATNDEIKPAVACNPEADQYLVVWADGRNWVTRGWDIYGRKVAATGERVGTDFRVSSTDATEDVFAAAVAHNGRTDQFLVVWADDRNRETRGSDIYGRRVAG